MTTTHPHYSTNQHTTTTHQRTPAHTHTKHTQHTSHTSDLSVPPSRAKTAHSSRAVANKRTSEQAPRQCCIRARVRAFTALAPSPPCPLASATIREDRNTSRSSVSFLLRVVCCVLHAACCVLLSVSTFDKVLCALCVVFGVCCVWCVLCLVRCAWCVVLCLAGADLYLQVRPLKQAKRLEQPTTYNRKRPLAGRPNVAKSSSPQGRRATARTSKTSCSNPHRM